MHLVINLDGVQKPEVDDRSLTIDDPHRSSRVDHRGSLIDDRYYSSMITLCRAVPCRAVPRRAAVTRAGDRTEATAGAGCTRVGGGIQYGGGVGGML